MLWTGPTKDGISQSLLQKYIICRERFRIRVVEGLVPDEGFNHRIEYGNLGHVACETFASEGGLTPAVFDAIDDYAKNLTNRYIGSREEIEKWRYLLRGQFQLYVDFWESRQGKVESGRDQFLSEEKFHVDYTLPSGRHITLRGKWDSAFHPQKGSPSVFLQENKFKGKVDENGLDRQLEDDLQSMFYCISLRNYLDNTKPDAILEGVYYNVVKRPLSGWSSIRQKKSETRIEFLDRAIQQIADNPEDYFMRWRVSVTPHDIARFKTQTLHPLLENLVDDWEWWEFCERPDIAIHQTNPQSLIYDYLIRGAEFPHHQNRHYRRPLGVYDAMSDGMYGDYHTYLTTGSKTGLTQATTLFPELD